MPPRAARALRTPARREGGRRPPRAHVVLALGLTGAAAVALAAAWAAGGIVRPDDPALAAALLAAAALSERWSIRLDARATYTALTPVVVLGGLLGGAAVGAGCALAGQLGRRNTSWHRRLAILAPAVLVGVCAGLLDGVGGEGAGRTLLLAGLALTAAVAINTTGRWLLLAAGAARPLHRPLLSGVGVDLAECLVAAPLVAVLVTVAAESRGLALAGLGAMLAVIGLAHRARETTATALAGEQEAARRDLLTGAPNRRAFEEALVMEQSRIDRGGPSAGLFVVDIDRFKSVNDRFGHQVGDEVIAGVVARLREGLRTCDVVARWGGEEITVLAPGIPNVDVLARFGERLRRLVGDVPLATRAHAIPVTVSVGGTLLDGTGAPAAALRSADAALYDAKRTRDATVVAPPRRSGLRLDDAFRKVS